jgi:DNA-binding response OmpR family regulator
MCILVVDDDASTRQMLTQLFRRKNFETITAEDGESGIKLAKAKLPNLVVVDFNLASMSGLEVCQALRRDTKTCSIPILVVAEENKDGQEVICLELGADAYLAKPLDMPRFLAHVNALMRRGPYLGRRPGVIEKPGIKLDIERKSVEIDGAAFTNLTPKEFGLLYYLVYNDSVPVPREVLYQKIWENQPVSKSVLRTVDVHVQRIRTKLKLEKKSNILSISGRGYMWVSYSPRASAPAVNFL